MNKVFEKILFLPQKSEDRRVFKHIYCTLGTSGQWNFFYAC
jgi:hypothetical protein